MEYVIGLMHNKNSAFPASLGIMEKERYIRLHGDVPENNPEFKIVKEWPVNFVGRINDILTPIRYGENFYVYHIPPKHLGKVVEKLSRLNLSS